MTMPSEPVYGGDELEHNHAIEDYIDALRAHAKAETRRADELAQEVERLRKMTPVANVTLSGDAEHWKQRAEQAEAALAELRNWLDSNTTFYNTAEIAGPVLASVSKRIWYHATDDMQSFPFSAAIDAAKERK